MARRIRYDAWSPGRGRTWTSPWCEPGFAVEELVASWSATTPRGSWIEVAAQARGRRAWHVLGRWASGRSTSRRTSVSGDAEVATDAWFPPGGVDAYRLRVTRHGSGATQPEVHQVGAVVSAGPVRSTTSSPRARQERVLDVPRLSQLEWLDVGGAGWCSPASVAMVLAHAGTLPPTTDSGSVVARAAAEVLDPAYGAGNWPFNTAWAATLTGRAHVTRLHDLRAAERFIDAGIPLVASVAYPRGGLRGAPVRSTDGHLVVIRGFTADGSVVTNDPAATSVRTVRRTYDRGQFERAWLGGSGGLVYVIHREDQPIPFD
jgi:Peptidase_C39 like family